MEKYPGERSATVEARLRSSRKQKKKILFSIQNGCLRLWASRLSIDLLLGKNVPLYVGLPESTTKEKAKRTL